MSEFSICFSVEQHYTESMVDIVIYVISPSDYTGRRWAGVGPKDGSCHQIVEDRPWSVR